MQTLERCTQSPQTEKLKQNKVVLNNLLHFVIFYEKRKKRLLLSKILQHRASKICTSMPRLSKCFKIRIYASNRCYKANYSRKFSHSLFTPQHTLCLRPLRVFSAEEQKTGAKGSLHSQDAAEPLEMFYLTFTHRFSS